VGDTTEDYGGRVTETPKRQRLTEEELHEAYGAIRLCHPKIPRVYADHLQAREDRKALAAEIRATAFYRDNHGDGALCWCGPEYGPCYVGAGTRDPDCERRTRLLAEVGE
jgi:hypothetical protein